jgi:HEAT repeat protein
MFTHFANWIVVIGAVLTAGIVFVRRLQAGEPGFREVVKNPELLDGADESEKELAKFIEEARKWDDAAIGRAVRHFVFDVKSSRDGWFVMRALRELGSRLHPHLLAILKDPSLRERLLKPTKKDILPEAPFNRVCDLFDEAPPGDAVLVLASFADNDSAGIRKDAAIMLGGAGTAGIVVPLRKAMADSDEYVRSYALMGLQRAIKRGGLAPECPKELFDDVARLLAEGKNADNAADVLLSFDERRAAEFLLSPIIFTPESKSLHRSLEALSSRKLKAPRDRLLELIRQLEAGSMEYPRTYGLGESLRMLGRHRHPGDNEFLGKRLKHPQEQAAEGAAAGLILWHGLDGFTERLSEKMDSKGFAALTPQQQHWETVVMFDSEVNNGGLSQYFFNSSGEHWKIALAGLDAIGAKERAGILREAVALFGAAPPVTVRRERQDQLAKVARQNEKALSALDDRYYKSTESIEVLLTEYVLNHPEAFK